MFPTLESFNAVMDQTTENYECLVINNNAKSNKLNDQIFWYKAESHGDFKLGLKNFGVCLKILDRTTMKYTTPVKTVNERKPTSMSKNQPQQINGINTIN
jgi:hypothetical protein